MSYNIFAAATVYSIGSFGLLSSFSSIHIIKKQPLLHSAFGLICGVHSIIESFILFNYMFPIFSSVWINPELEKSSFTAFMGYFQTACHTASVYIQVVKSSNRCFAILFPGQYRIAFTCKNTIIFLGISSCFCFVHVTLFIYYGCYYFYSNQFYAWSFYKPECDESPGAIINLVTQIALVSFTLALDGFILGFLWRRKRNTHTKLGEKEKRFFFQTCLTSLFHAGMLIPPRLLKPLTTKQFLIFLTGTPSMMTFHAMNEFLFVAFTFNSIRKRNSLVAVVSKTTNTPVITNNTTK